MGVQAQTLLLTRRPSSTCVSALCQLRSYHARPTTNVHRATHAENYAHCVNCDRNFWRLRMRICSEIHSISWHNKEFAQMVSTELLLAFNPAASRRHVHRRFQIHCVLLHSTVSSLHSTNRRRASRFHQLVSKLIRLVSKLSVTLLNLDTLPLFI